MNSSVWVTGRPTEVSRPVIGTSAQVRAEVVEAVLVEHRGVEGSDEPHFPARNARLDHSSPLGCPGSPR